MFDSGLIREGYLGAFRGHDRGFKVIFSQQSSQVGDNC